MKNHLIDLHNHLFAQIERLNDEDLTGEDLMKEINRSNAMIGVAGMIVANGNLMIKASIAVDNAMGDISLNLMTEKQGITLSERRKRKNDKDEANPRNERPRLLRIIKGV